MRNKCSPNRNNINQSKRRILLPSLLIGPPPGLPGGRVLGQRLSLPLLLRRRLVRVPGRLGRAAGLPRRRGRLGRRLDRLQRRTGFVTS